MSEKRFNNVIRFPERKSVPEIQPIETLSPQEALREVIKAIQDEPDVKETSPVTKFAKSKVPRRKAALAQVIEGDQNIQTMNNKVAKQSIKGNRNVQIGGDVNHIIRISTTKGPKIEVTAPSGSIGANSALRIRIEELIKQINEYRYDRIGRGYKFGAIYGELATAFGLKRADWKAIWLWEQSRAEELIVWLESKCDNTQQGRINRVSKGEGYRHTRGHLFRIEKDYMAQLEWDDDTIRTRQRLITGKTSRADMTDNELRNWVGYLRHEAESIYNETNN